MNLSERSANGAKHGISEAGNLAASIVNSSFDAIISKTLDGTITSWNPAASELFGYHPDEMIGESVRRLIPSDRQDEEDRILARINAGERVESYVTVRLDKEQHPIDISLTISPIWDQSRKIIGASKIIRPIAAQKDAAEALHWRQFVDQVPVAMLMLDRNMFLLSRDSPVDQRIDISLTVQGFDGGVDFAIKLFDIGEGLMGEMTRLEVVPDYLTVIELWRVFGQPLDGQPVLARIERRQGDFADMDRPIILDQHDGYCHAPGLGAKEAIELIQMRNEVGAALGPARMHDEPAFYMIERTHHGHLLGLPRRRHAQTGAAFGQK